MSRLDPDRPGGLESMDALLHILRGAPIVLFALDREGRFLFGEGRGLAALGLVPNEWVGLSAFDVYPPDSEAIDAVRRALAGEEFTAVVQTDPVCFEVRYAPLRGADGSLAGTIGVAVDVTARETALRASERQLEVARALAGVSRNLLAGAGDPAGAEFTRAVETVARLAQADQGLLLTFGTWQGSRNERFQWSVPGVVSPESLAFPWVARRLLAGETIAISDVRELGAEAEFERNDMLARGVQAALLFPLQAEGRLIGTFGVTCRAPRKWEEQDIVWLRVVVDLFALALRRRWTEEVLAARQAQLLQAQKMDAVGRLAGGIAHDFNNLLLVIAGNAASLAEGVDKESAAGEDLTEIQVAAERAAALTRQILAFGRPKAVANERFDANDVIQGLAAMLRRVLGEDVSLELDLDRELGVVSGDPAQLEQVLVNLAVNARDAMPEGGMLRIATLRRILRGPIAQRLGIAEGEYAMLSVSDTGNGMSEETRARAFEPFYSTKPPETGTGLGLSIVYEVVRRWGGGIEIESTLGQGTRVRIDLPCAQGTLPARESRPFEMPGGSERVLIAEDDPAVRRLLVRVLQAGGYSVLEAADGSDALALASEAEAPIDLLVSDVVMPTLGGLDLVRRLRAANPRLRVILISGFPERAADRGEPPRVDGFLQKPFLPHVLLKKVRDVLDVP